MFWLLLERLVFFYYSFLRFNVFNVFSHLIVAAVSVSLFSKSSFLEHKFLCYFYADIPYSYIIKQNIKILVCIHVIKQERERGDSIDCR